MADRLAVMDNGEVQQIGSPEEVYRMPKNTYVASFIGETNLVSAQAKSDADKNSIFVDTIAGQFFGRLSLEGWEPSTGDSVTASIRPEAIKIIKASDDPQGHITETTYLGETIQYKVAMADDTEIQVSEMNPRQVLETGQGVVLEIQPEDVIVLKD